MDTGAMDTGDGDSGGSGSGGESGLCLPKPTRLIVFGDSIAACFGVGGKQSNDCAPKIVQQYISDTYGPVSYENLAVNGDRTTHVPDQQLPGMEVGPGHALVMIYIGGNDLAQYIFSSDDEAVNAWENTTGPEVAQKWEEIFDFLEDPANFPDGVTLLMNNQYNPFDDCTAPPYESVTPIKTMLLHQHNDALAERAAAHDIAFITDQHSSYLGHGHHFDDSSCRSYIEGGQGWMFDIIHPNVAGHRNLADEMQLVVDSFYDGCE
jgi:lysophospholipase L1-like esterase